MKRRKTTTMNDDAAKMALSAPSRAATPVYQVASSPTMPSPPSDSRYRSSDLVTLLVGSDKEVLIAHAHRLSKTSGFFQAALKKHWKEGQTRIIELPEEKPEYVLYYLDFAYQGILPSHDVEDGNDMRDAGGRHTRIIRELYMFGERMVDSSLRNAIIKEMIRLSSLKDDDKHRWIPNWHTAAKVYQSTAAGSPIRRLMVDLLVTNGQPGWMDKADLDDCSELLIDVVKRYNGKAMDGQNPKEFRDKVLKAEDYFA